MKVIPETRKLDIYVLFHTFKGYYLSFKQNFIDLNYMQIVNC